MVPAMPVHLLGLEMIDLILGDNRRLGGLPAL